jgi:hypothetical protein
MLKKEIKHIINLLDDHIKIRPNHKESCIDLKKRFISFQDALEKEEDVTDFINWCKWFAPRIIFDGIGNKEILESLERLNENHLT